MNRDLYIDFAKGLATLSIIFIHTAFWSGQFYITTEVRVFSLVFDVALFYALSGITSGNNLEKTFYRLRENMKTYMDKVCDDYEVLAVTRKENRNVVMMSEEYYNNLLENIYVMGNKANYEWLMKGKSQIDAGLMSEHDLIEDEDE